MTKANLRLFLLGGAAACTAFAGAQTSTTHHTSTASHHPAAHPAVKSQCVTLPALSPKIPAAPAGTSCPRALYTVTEKIDYMSPLIGPIVRQGFSNLPMTFTLAYADLKVGTGALAQPHMWYTVQYTGYLPDGTKFDASADHPGKPFAFPYGAHRVIPGWDTGFEGMHVGGKRRLFVPFQLAYGERGRPPVIPAKAELIFDMELIAQSPDDPNAPPTPPTPPAGAAPAAPPAPGSLPATPPTRNPGMAPQAQPQTAPDVKPAPPTPDAPATPQTAPSTPNPQAQPSAPKQPPPQGV